MLLYHSCPKGYDADVAQSVERRLGKAEVTGPIPVSSFSKREVGPLFFCFMAGYVNCRLLEKNMLK